MKTVFRAILSCVILTGLACDGKKTEKPSTRAARPGVTETTWPASDKLIEGQTLYVPIYSSVYSADSASQVDLAATLFVRNTDLSRPIILVRAEYFDSGGQSLKKFVNGPLKIGPLASVDFFIKESDQTGGASPSFLVEWVATETVSRPVVESVMIGTTGSQGISFTCPARVIDVAKP